MEPRRLLVISLALNVAALAVVGVVWKRTSKQHDAVESLAPSPVLRMPPAEPASPAAVTIVTNANPPPSVAFDWREVESADYLEYIQKLRDIGCPELTVRDIIIADVCRLYGEKRAALAEPEKTFRFWESSERQYLRDNVRYQLAARALEKEKSDLIRELLGVDLRRELGFIYGNSDEFDRSLAFLPVDRRRQVQDVINQYRDMERAIYAEANGKLSEEQRAQIDALKEQRTSAINSMMSPEEQTEYEMTNSRLVSNIRGNLNGFDANKDEFMAIYETQKAFEEQFKDVDRKKETPEQKQARQAAELAAQSAIEQQLGPARYAEWKRSQDNDYEDLYELTRRHDLSKETAVAVYDIKKLTDARVKEIDSLSGYTPEQKLEYKKQLADQIKRSAEQSLGEDAYKSYLRRDGRWMDRIARPPEAPKVIRTSGVELEVLTR